MNEESIYKKYSENNPYDSIGLKDYHEIRDHKHYYYIPTFLRKDSGEGGFVSIYNMRSIMFPEITYQIYYDLVVLGISSIKDRPKCEHCGKEARFSFIWDHHPQGYREYCLDKLCRYKTTAGKASEKMKGRPLSETNKANISKAKKGKKLTEEQRLRRPRGYHFKMTLEQRIKISLSKKGKVMSRSFYNSGKFQSKKFNKEITYLSSYERDFLSICEGSKQIVSLEIPDPIRYNYAGGPHNYYPDFLITVDSGEKFLIEVKAKNLINTEKVIAKRIAGKKWCAKNKIKYTTVTEDHIYLKKKYFDAKGLKRINRQLSLFDLVA